MQKYKKNLNFKNIFAIFTKSCIFAVDKTVHLDKNIDWQHDVYKGLLSE